jgi:uncharacterized protein (DUF2141 family)
MKELLLAFCFAATTALKAQNLTLTVNIKNFKNNDGMAVVFLQDPSKKTLQQLWVKIDKNAAQAIFKNLNRGAYAVWMYHDKNGNKKMDTGFLKIPTEGWGCSNNVKPIFAAPKFEDMIFELSKDQSILITIN